MGILKPYQLEGVRKIREFRGRAILADEMGLGKTVQALFWIYKTGIRPAVIVCPASVKYHWQAEASMHFGMPVSVLEGRSPRKIDPGEVVVLNYDILPYWIPALLETPPQCLVLDEAHFCKNVSAKRTRAAFRLARVSRSVLALTGTPLTNRPIELWPIVHMVRPDLFPSRMAFAWRYCKPRYTPWGWKFDGATRLDELHRILYSQCMIRRTKREVLPDLPEKVRRIVFYQLPDRTEYERAQTDFLRWLSDIDPLRAQSAARAEALAKMGYLLRLVARLKLPWVLQWIRDFLEANPDEKLVCFSSHTFVLDFLLQQLGSAAVLVDGRVTGRVRHETVRKFQNLRRIRVFLGQWIAAGTGLNLSAAHHVAALDLPWTPGDLVQAEDRIHRIGQKNTCLVHYLITRNTVEEKQIQLIQKKARILRDVLEGRRQRVRSWSIWELAQLLNEG